MHSFKLFLFVLAWTVQVHEQSYSQSDDKEARKSLPILVDTWEARGTFAWGFDFPVHEQFKELRQLEVDPLLPNHEFSYKIEPSMVYALGVMVGKRQFERVTVGSGLRLAKKGYRLVAKTTFRDPVYQFDEYTTEIARLRVWALEAPLWTAYQLAEGWKLEIGTIPGLNLRSTARVISRGQSDVFINGELDGDRSQTWEKKKTKVSQGIASLSLGWYGSVRRQIGPSVEWATTFAMPGGYIEQQTEEVAGCRVTTGIQVLF